MPILKVQLAEIAVKRMKGYAVCTGYAISAELVLTAGHIFSDTDDSQDIQIRFTGNQEVWVTGKVIWSNKIERQDAALIRLQLKREGGNNTCFGLIPTKQKRWLGGGFPSAGKCESIEGIAFRETVGISGNVEPFGGLVGGLMDLTVESNPRNADDWKGLSGSPVFVGENLIGIISSVPEAFTGARLKAVSIQNLKQDKKFDEITKDIFYDDNNDYKAKFFKLFNLLANTAFKDNSIYTPNRKIEKLSRLIKLKELLSEQELDILLVSLYLYNLKTNDAYLPEKPEFVEESTYNISNSLIQLVDDEQDLQAISRLFLPVRGELLYTLLKFANLLDLENAALNDTEVTPSDTNTILDWITYLTHNINVRNFGIIEYSIRLNPEDKLFQDDIKWYIALYFEAFYQKYRNVLTSSNIAVSRAETISIFSKNVVKIPESIKSIIKDENNRLVECIKPIYHLGEVESYSISKIINSYKIDSILPLPFTEIIDRIEINLPDENNYCLSLIQVRFDNFEDYIGELKELLPSNGRTVCIEKDLINPDCAYRWWIEKKNPDFYNTITSGVFRTFTKDKTSLFLRLMTDKSINEDLISSIKYNFELLNMLVSDIWNRDLNHISENEIMLLFRIFQESISWLEKWYPTSGRIDIYRDMSINLYELVKTNNQKTK